MNERYLAVAILFATWLNGSAPPSRETPEDPGPPPECPPGFTARLVEVGGKETWACCGSPPVS